MPRVIAYELIQSNGRVYSGQSEFPDNPMSSGEWFLHLRGLFKSLMGDDIALERVNVWHKGRYTDMLVDENGRIKRLPLNVQATGIYRANVLENDPNPPPPQMMPAIYGNAILFSEKVWA